MIRIENLRVDLPGFALRVDELEVPRGGFFALLGPTGSGKTLILESVAGLTSMAGVRVRGGIFVDGREVGSLSPEHRGVSIVYQDNALFPHLDLLGNATYGLRCRGVGRAEAESRVGGLLEMLGLAHLAGRGVAELSGGERQRVALVRALAVEPDVLLLDEPLSALDPNFRGDVRAMLGRLHRELGVTMFMVTHDFTDAQVLARSVAVLDRGRIEQMGTPDDVFLRPANRFVAGFVGMDNVFEASLRRGGDGGTLVDFCGLRCSLPGPVTDGARHAAVRPEDVDLALDGRTPPAGSAALRGRLVSVESRGFLCEALVDCGGERFRVLKDRRAFMDGRGEPGAEVLLWFDPSRVHVF